ncbi:unnamed protein product [Toxocara canis]|uniref:Rad60-SLD domain-containing protein n=1 Tax=Toxocara canis TaxID=6265 RepID=A0A183U554_TOXCA|nr:unnamed protein product [Toxocara canis]
MLEHWAQSDAALAVEFQVGKFALLLDRRPLVSMSSDKRLMNLRILHYSELKYKLADYGLSIDMADSALLDADQNSAGDFTAVFGSSLRTVEMPDDSPISIDKLRGELAETLGGTFVDLRRAMLTLESDHDRGLLAKVFISACPNADHWSLNMGDRVMDGGWGRYFKETKSRGSTKKHRPDGDCAVRIC